MTKSELRHFAKEKGIPLSRAREIVRQTAKDQIKDSRIFADHKATVDPLWIDGPTVGDERNTGPMNGPRIILTPGGLSNENWGIANIQIYGPEGQNNDESVYSAETAMCRSYVTSINSMCWGVQPGFRICMEPLNSTHQMIIAILGDWKVMGDTDAKLEALIKLATNALPYKVQQYGAKHFNDDCRVWIDDKDFKVGSPPYIDRLQRGIETMSNRDEYIAELQLMNRDHLLIMLILLSDEVTAEQMASAQRRLNGMLQEED